MVLATSGPGWPVTQRKLSAGGHPGEVHVDTRPVTAVSRCPGVREWSAAGLTFPRRQMASGATVEKTCSRGSSRESATVAPLSDERRRAGRLTGQVQMAITAG